MGNKLLRGVDYSWETIDEMEELIISSNKPMVINGYGTTTSENTIVLGNHVSACEINVTLKNVQIDVSEYAGMAAIKILDHYSEKVSLLLSGSNEIKSGDQCAGLMKNNGEQLTITGDGRLTAFGGDDGAGIGGGRDADGKNITIKGGTITATGGKRAIGIGGGFSATTTNIQICDASVKVNAGAFITANGSLSIRQDFLPVNIDSEERVYPVIINHNQETSVTYQKTDVSGATKHILSFPSFHPGDGNFYLYLEAGIYDISVGNREYKGIEVGEEKTVFCTEKVTDRQIVLHNASYQRIEIAGDYYILDGVKYDCSETNSELPYVISQTGSETIDGNIRVISGCAIQLNGIKINAEKRASSSLFIDTKEKVSLYSLKNTQNIFQAYDGYAGIHKQNKEGLLYLDGEGSITSNGGGSAAGIGGAIANTGGRNITITGGIVTAAGGNGAAGIGGGNYGSGENITIAGGTVTATAGGDIQGIGKGNFGNHTNNISISGGSVHATKKVTGACNYPEGMAGRTAVSEVIYTNNLQPNTMYSISFLSSSGHAYYNAKNVITDETGKLYFYLPTSSSVSDAQIKAQYRVNFMDGEIELFHKMTEGCASIQEPEAPKKRGYEFHGWYLVSDPSLQKDATRWDFDTLISSNSVLYARFEKLADDMPDENFEGVFENIEITFAGEKSGKPVSYNYTGEEIRPAVKVMCEETNQSILTKKKKVKLTENVDYTVLYRNNINTSVSGAEIIVRGIGDYSGTLKRTFSIEQKSFKKVLLDPLASIAYAENGIADLILEQVQVHDQTKIVPQSSYSVMIYEDAGCKTLVGGSISDNKCVSANVSQDVTYYIKVSANGVGNYIKEQAKAVQCVTVFSKSNSSNNGGKLDLSKCRVYLASNDAKKNESGLIVYTGKAVKPKVIVLDTWGNKVQAGNYSILNLEAAISYSEETIAFLLMKRTLIAGFRDNKCLLQLHHYQEA